VKPNVIAATGYQTARLINATFVKNQVGEGIRSMSTPELSVSFGSQAAGDEDAMHPMAVQLLKQSRRIAIAWVSDSLLREWYECSQKVSAFRPRSRRIEPALTTRSRASPHWSGQSQ